MNKKSSKIILLFFLIFLLTTNTLAIPLSSPIKKVVVLMMENRSFDHMLGWLKEKNQEIDGLNGEQCNFVQSSNPQSKKVCVNKHGYDVSPDDPHHDLNSTTEQIFGFRAAPSAQGLTPKMDGFVQNAAESHHKEDNPMSMFTSEIDSAPIINTLASEFAVFDRWFASVPGPTDPNRGYAMAGTSAGVTHNFDGTLWKTRSYFDFLTHHNVSWNAYYDTNPWAIFYFEDMRKPENLVNALEIDEFFKNVENGELAQFTFLQPRLSNSKRGPPNWQHPDASIREGERLVKRVYETLRKSEFWNELAFVLTYDEHGGFYDHVTPPQQGIPNPDGLNSPYGFKFNRLGIRIPTVVISPWIPKSTVVHEPTGPTDTSQYEHTSVMSTVNKLFGISEHLSKRAEWSGTFEDVFSLSESRKDCPEHLPELPKWTLQDILDQNQKPLNDHLEIQINFYCKFNNRDLETCGKDIHTQEQAFEFLETEIPYFINNLRSESAK